MTGRSGAPPSSFLLLARISQNPRRENAVDATADHFRHRGLAELAVAGVVQGVVEGPVSPMRSSNWRMGCRRNR